MSWRNRKRWNQGSALPDRWLNYSNTGSRIPGTRFICMKVPLKQELCRQLAEDQWFTPAHVISEVVTRGGGGTLGLLIDLTNTYRYYDPKEIEAVGVAHAKIMVRGHDVPGQKEVQHFFDVVDQFECDQNDSGDDSILIGVHCTHGVNRTGYLVCRYLIDRKGWTIEKAVAEFNSARGHFIERENYLEALHLPPEIPSYAESSGIEPAGEHTSSSTARESLFNGNNDADRRFTRDSRPAEPLERPYRRPDFHYDRRWTREERGNSSSSGNWRGSSSDAYYRDVPSDQHSYDCTDQFRWWRAEDVHGPTRRHRHGPDDRR